MRFNLLTTAAAATVFLCPAMALAQTDPAAPAAAAAAPAAPAATPAPAPLPPSPNLVANGDWIATLKSSTHFTILVKALDQNGLSAQLKAYPNLTIFAPTDEAFKALPAAELQLLLSPAGSNDLRKILTYHLVNAQIDAAKIKGAKGDVPTVDGPNVSLDGSGDVLMVNNADIIQSDVKAANGVIVHAIDKVLIPSDVTVQGATAAAPAASPSAGG